MAGTCARGGLAFLVFLHRFVVAVAAEGLVGVLFAQDDEFAAVGEAVGEVGEGAAADADGMDLLDVVGDGEESRHGPEGLAQVVGVQAGDDDADAAVGQFLDHADDAVVKELCLVDAYDLDVRVDLEHPGRGLDGGAGNAVGIVGDDIQVRVALVHRGLERGDSLLGELGALEPPDEFFRLPREHRAADEFDAARFFCVFQKHFLTLL